MRFIQRDSDGKIVGHFANEQSYATEAVEDDHPEIVAWYDEREARRKAAISPEIRIAALEAEVIRLRGLVG
jgi:glutathione S-transferase